MIVVGDGGCVVFENKARLSLGLDMSINDTTILTWSCTLRPSLFCLNLHEESEAATQTNETPADWCELDRLQAASFTSFSRPVDKCFRLILVCTN